MAKIYKIWNEKLEVHRAIKIVLPSHQAELVQRFETEAKITAKLHHPNIVEIYSVGEHRGLPFIEMEYIDGKPLDSLIGRMGRLPPEVCCAIAVCIVRALVYAHGQDFLLYGKTYHGVIHRDLKPANIMITTKGLVKLMDFGIARPTETSLHTVDGNIVGTMQYLSPEQLDGMDIDRRTDIYSFGAILYEMLTGTKAFPQNSLQTLLKMKAINSYRPLAEFPLALPQVLVKITQKCLEISKEQRYGSAEELLEAMQKAYDSIGSGEPESLIASYLDSPHQYPAVKYPDLRKYSLPLISGAVSLLVIIGAIIFLVASPPRVGTVRGKEQKKTAHSKGLASTEPEARADQTASRESEQARVSAPEPPAVRPERKQSGQPPKHLPAAARTARLPAASSPINDLMKQYGTDDLAALARTALDRNNPGDARAALSALPAALAASDRVKMLSLETFIAAGQLGDARAQAAGITPGDAQFDYLRGLLEEKSGNDGKAVSYYSAALTRPSDLRGIQSLRMDALYQMALIQDRQYRESPTADLRIQALNAWNVVKRAYSDSPQHPRFKMANTKLSTIQ
jgi:serine/threonine protein kinase